MDESIVATIILTARNLASGTIAQVGTELTAMGNKGASSGERLAAGMSKAAVGVGALTVGVAAFSVHEAVQFQDAILKVANNTGMSTHEMEQMRSSVLKLGAEGPAPLSEIAQGFEKAANAGFHGAAGFTIVHAAMQAAVETGAKVPAVVDSVTGALKNFRLPASDAGKVLGEMMRAAAEGDVRLPDLTDNLNKVSVMAGALHLPLNQVLAAFSTLTTYTHNAALSQTVLYGALSHIIAPTKASTTEIEALSKASGVDLVGAYAAVRDHSIDLTTFLGVLRNALHGANLTTGQQTAAMYALGGGLRGGLALVSLLSQGWEDYNKRAKDVASSTGLVTDQWKRTSDTLDFQLGLLRNHVDELAITVGTTLVPALVGVSKDLIPATQNLQAFAQAHPGVVKGATEAGLAVGGAGLAIRAANFLLKPFGTSALGAGMSLGRLGVAAAGTEAGLTVLPVTLGLVGAALLNNYLNSKFLDSGLKQVTVSGKDFYQSLNHGGAVIKQASDTLREHIAGMQLVPVSYYQARNSMHDFGAAVDQVRGGLGGFTEAQKSAFVQGTAEAATITAQAVPQIKAHYDALKLGIEQDLVATKDQSREQWDAMRLHALDSQEKEAIGVLQSKEKEKDGLIQKTLEANDPIIQANLKRRDGVIKTFTEESAKVIETATKQALAVKQASMDAHHGVVTAAAQQSADHIMHAAKEQVGVLQHHENIKLGTIAKAREARTESDKANLQMATDGVKHAQNLAKGVDAALKGMPADVGGHFIRLHAQVTAQFEGMKGDVTTSSKGMADAAINEAKRMHHDIVGGSIVPEMRQGVVREMAQMAKESGAKAAEMKSLVEAQFAALAGDAEAYGASVGANFAAGLESEVPAAAKAGADITAAAKASMEFKSPNKKGDDPFKWGKSVGQNFAAGLSSEGAAVAAAANDILTQLRGKLGNVSIGPGGVGLGAEFAQLTAEMKKLPPDFQAAGEAIVKGYVQKVDAAEEKYNRARQTAINNFLAAEKVELELHPKQFGAWVTQHTQSLKEHLGSLRTALNEHVANLKKQIDAMKSPAGLWDGLKKQIDKVANDDLKALSLAILEGKGNIHGLAVEAANAQENAKRMGEAEDKAAIKIDKASGNVADAFDRLSKITSGELSAAENKYAYDLIHHTGNLAKDTAEIEKHSGAVTRDTDALAKAADVAKFTTDAIHALGSASFSAGRALGVVLTPTVNTLTTAAKSTTDAFTVLADTANKTLKDAEDQYALDLINHTGNLIADTQAIISAKDAVNGFSSALNAATAIADAVGAAAPVTAATAAAAAAAVTSSGPGYTVTVNPDGSVVTQQTSAVSTSPASSSNEPIFSTGSGTDKIAESIATVADKVQAVADNTATIATKQQTQIDQNAAELAELRQQNDWLTFNNDTLKELLGLAQAGVKGDVSSTQGLKKYKQRVQAHRAFHR